VARVAEVGHVCSRPMIAALVFVIGFLVLGLSVVFIAFSGGPAGTRRRTQTPSRTGRKVVFAVVGVVVVGLGLAVPLAIGVVNGNDHAKNAPGGVELSASAERGRSLFARNCATCHTLKAANAVGKVGPNLDTLSSLQASPWGAKALVLDAIAKGRARGNGQMPLGLLQGQDATDVANFVAAVAGHQ
jgi:mono/diheme cytochrome c family protein